ncbi:MAG: NAD-dependent epimerase [Deltaproteobacteria bacterium]|nr:NAD-dependent epimerase [Deltaproteobacteria bacterium]MBW2205275.1 NAD-dependent epimerase [Deltaproteobacteria bacterium]
MASDQQDATLVTGAAGFIGFHLSQALLDMGTPVVGVDNLNDYYDVALKKARLDQLERRSGFTFYRDDIENQPGLKKIFLNHPIRKICHLAAQAGVRYSLENPFSYQKSNLEGFLNLLEMARHGGVDNFVFASSSSVYGANTKIPFSVDDRVDTPVSLYGATKRANELMAYSYSHLFQIPCTGLRFFTVYGPWGRPDMALFLFTDAILHDRPIDIYNHGRMKRDFTYIDDIIEGTMAALKRPSTFELFNLGNSDPVELLDFIAAIEEGLGKKAKRNMMPIQPGDVPATAADIEKSKELLGFNPKTHIKEGIKNFLSWYRDYYGF